MLSFLSKFREIGTNVNSGSRKLDGKLDGHFSFDPDGEDNNSSNDAGTRALAWD